MVIEGYPSKEYAAHTIQPKRYTFANSSNVLILPFLQIASGHQHVADTLMKHILSSSCCNQCRKIEILSYSYGKIENFVSTTYLTWIQRLPSLYQWLYYHAAFKQSNVNKRFYLYESIFLYYLKEIIQNTKSNVIFCTHALPSNLACILKQKGRIKTTIVNVYTDYFINKLWGIHGVDYHFVPSKRVKQFLINKGVKEERIFVTGIPVDPEFLQVRKQKVSDPINRTQVNILISGGNLGVGANRKLLTSLKKTNNVHYYILCGKNEQLYYRLLIESDEHITPFRYISSREKMNEIYDRMDGILTKPGGVTVSECLIKRKPIFIYEPLPGQETYNAEELKKLGLVIEVDIHNGALEEQILSFFRNEKKKAYYFNRIEQFYRELEIKRVEEIVKDILYTSVR